MGGDNRRLRGRRAATTDQEEGGGSDAPMTSGDGTESVRKGVGEEGSRGRMSYCVIGYVTHI